MAFSLRNHALVFKGGSGCEYAGKGKNQYPPAMVAETMTATYIVPETARVTIFFILEWCLYGVYLCIALLLSIVRAA